MAKKRKITVGEGIFYAVLTGGVVVGVSYLVKGLSTRAAGEKLLSKPIDVAYKGVEGANFLMNLKFEFSNPTNTDMKMRYVFLDIFYDGNEIANIREQDMDFTIKANKVTFYTFHIKTSAISLGLKAVMLLSQIITGNTGDLPKKAIIKGYIKINEFQEDYNTEIPFEF